MKYCQHLKQTGDYCQNCTLMLKTLPNNAEQLMLMLSVLLLNLDSFSCIFLPSFFIIYERKADCTKMVRERL